MGLFSNFSGGDSRRDLRHAVRTSNTLIRDGMERGEGYLNSSYDRSRQDIDPYLESGQRGQQFYDDLLGLNGGDARDSRQDFLMSDRAFSGKLGQDQNAMLRAMNARGMSGSGAGALAAERVFQQNYGNTLNRYANRGQQGAQMAQFGAGMSQQNGAANANLQMQGAGMMSNNQMNAYGNISKTRNAGMNNMLAIAGAGTKMAGLF